MESSKSKKDLCEYLFNNDLFEVSCVKRLEDSLYTHWMYKEACQKINDKLKKEMELQIKITELKCKNYYEDKFTKEIATIKRKELALRRQLEGALEKDLDWIENLKKDNEILNKDNAEFAKRIANLTHLHENLKQTYEKDTSELNAKLKKLEAQQTLDKITIKKIKKEIECLSKRNNRSNL
jgi:uncharacterized protein with von Willebrand factor type A (vWA) domain